MIELLKAYTNELDLVYDQIEILWAEADEYLKDEYYLSEDFHNQQRRT